MRPDWLVAPEILPDELDCGFLGTLLRLNGMGTGDINLANRKLAALSQQGKPLSAWDTYISLAEISGQSENDFLKHHTLLPWREALVRDGHYGEGTDRRVADRKVAIGLIRNGAAWCPQCAIEDVSFHGRPFWRRRHQLPGTFHCDTHGVQLHREKRKDAFLKSPSALGLGRATTDPSREPNAAGVEESFGELLYQLGVQSMRLNERVLSSRIRGNILTLAEDKERQIKVLSDCILKCSPDFLGEILPKSVCDAQDLTVYLAKFIQTHHLSALPPYIFLLLLTEASFDAAWKFLVEEASVEPARQNTAADVGAPDQKLREAFVAEAGCIENSAKRLGLSENLAARRFAELGLHNLQVTEFKGAWLFWAIGQSIADSASAVGLSASDLESVIRRGGGPLAETLQLFSRASVSTH